MMRLKVENWVCCADSYVLCYACICGPKHIFRLRIILACISVENSTYFGVFCFLVIIKLG